MKKLLSFCIANSYQNDKLIRLNLISMRNYRANFLDSLFLLVIVYCLLGSKLLKVKLL